MGHPLHVICASSAHCQKCREAGDAGDAWRLSLARFYDVPGDAKRFECPHGKAWGHTQAQPPPPPRGLGDVVKAVIHGVGLGRLAPKGCGCKKRQAMLNRWFPFRH